MTHLVLKTTVSADHPQTACDFLATRTGLSKSKVKDAMNKGAAWIKKRGSLIRLRRASAELKTGDYLEFHYDEGLLALQPPDARCLTDEGQFSVWHKPAGLMAQGTMYGDHCSIMRQAELLLGPSRKVYLVHRLDREASGLMLFAHSREAAAGLSGLFQKNLVIKKYRAEVLGKPGEKERRVTIELPLDGKPALTELEVEAYSAETNTSTVLITIRTGRLHQIRRHLAMIGFPVMGDPRYGKGNKNREGMKLTAICLRFRCPFRNREVEFSLPEQHC